MARVPEPDLAHAVVRCQAGDKQAFKLIADFHGERLYGIASLVVGDRHKAGDAVQETLLHEYEIEAQLLSSLSAQCLTHRFVTRVSNVDVNSSGGEPLEDVVSA